MLVWHEYNSMSNCADAMIRTMRTMLTAATKAGSSTHIVLPGGSTPRTLIQCWHAMSLHTNHITPSDERCVPVTHPHSNEGMLRTLAPSMAESLFSYHATTQTPDAQAITCSETLAQLPSPTLAICGIGTDGHIASLFNLKDCEPTTPCIATTAPNGDDRLSLSLPYLMQSRNMWLLVSGEKKRDIIMQQSRSSTLPVGVLLGRYAGAVQVYWTP